METVTVLKWQVLVHRMCILLQVHRFYTLDLVIHLKLLSEVKVSTLS